jgi:2-polyprenyl-3-methyl-5-hydroxy-6-metoxy-1,4-benzoquinol methylase
MHKEWNHNTHYHDLVLRSIPANCQHALDVGCGEGLLSRQLAILCERVTAIDADHEALQRGSAASLAEDGITFVEGDVMTHPLGDECFDFIAVVATLHHLPLRPALGRFYSLLRPGGVLSIIGLYRPGTIQDYALAVAGKSASWVLRWFRTLAEVKAPLQEPGETLGEIRKACDALLPGNKFRRHLLFRYSVVWRKP